MNQLSIDPVTLTIFLILFGFVTVLGFVAARWRRGDLTKLNEWGLGGHRFGTFMTWFLLGGDFYTAYTFIGLPAFLYGAGAIGFFALPFTILIYPILYAIFPKVWAYARQNGFVTAADIAQGNTGDKGMMLAVAVTGLLATLPAIALQLIGIQVVIAGLGLSFSGWLTDAPLIIAFLVLAAFTYTSGLRAPAMIAIVKDVLVYATLIAVLVIVPSQLGGFDKIFSAVPAGKILLPSPAATPWAAYTAYASLAIGSAIGFFLQPFALTGILSAKSGEVLRRNAVMMPIYTVMLGLMGLMGFMAIAAGVDKMPEFGEAFKLYGNNFAVPAMLLATFPKWFLGIAFAAIAIGALVPAAVMSIATANIFSRNIYRGFLRPDCTEAQESQVAKLASLLVKVGALLVIFLLPVHYAVEMQLLGGVWNMQIIPSVILALYCKFFDRRALLAGWAVGIALGSWLVFSNKVMPVYPLNVFGVTIPFYAALIALVANIAVASVLTPVFRRLGTGASPLASR